MKKRIVCLLGLPGSGKSSLGKAAARMFDMEYISTGDIAREIVEGMTENPLKHGDLGPENKIREKVVDLIRKTDKNIILDGMPRHGKQLVWLMETFKDHELRYVHIDIPLHECINRLTNRMRSDDSETVIRKRIDTYRTKTEPVLNMVWKSTFKPAPYAPFDLIVRDFCEFLMDTRTVDKIVKIKLLPDHPFYGMSPEEIEKEIDNPATSAVLFKKYKGDAGVDLFISKPLVVEPYGKANVHTHIAIEAPPYFWINMDKRSSTFYVRDMLIVEAIIDCGYRGELFCTVYNVDNKEQVLEAGDSIAQIIFEKLLGDDFKYKLVSELSDSDRQDNGFGSTTEHKEKIKNLYQKSMLRKVN